MAQPWCCIGSILLLLTTIDAGRKPALPDAYTATCHERCRCNKTVIECIGVGAVSSDVFLFMRPEVYADIDTIVVVGNRIRRLESELFGAAVSHTSVTLLNATANRIERIDDAALSALPRLQYLYLSDNNISQLGDSILASLPLLRVIDVSSTFDHRLDPSRRASLIAALFHLPGTDQFTHLQDIRLDSNQLDRMPFTAVECHRLPALMRLRLANNHLTTLETIDPSCFPVLEQLDLSNNRFVRITAAQVHLIDTALPVIDSLDLSDNPLHCSCESRALIEFARVNEKIFISRADTTCTTSDVGKRSIFEVDIDQLCGTAAGSIHQFVIALAIIVALSTLAYMVHRMGLVRRILVRRSTSTNKFSMGGYHQLRAEQDAPVPV